MRGTVANPDITVLLWGPWIDSENLGDHLMLKGALDALRSGGTRVRVNVIGVPYSGVVTSRRTPSASTWRKPTYWWRLLRTDALIFMGGVPFRDHLPQLLSQLVATAIVKARGRPVIIVGVSLRSFSSRIGIRAIRTILRASNIVLLRESWSLSITREFLQDTTAGVLSGDFAGVAVLSTPLNELSRFRLIDDSERQVNRNEVWIIPRSFSGSTSFESQHLSRNLTPHQILVYRNSLVKLALQAQQSGAHVKFAALNFGGPDDDEAFCLDIANQLPFPTSRTRVTSGEEALRLFAGSGCVIASRYHGAYLGIAASVPTVALSYSNKTEFLMRDAGLARSCVDIRSHTDQVDFMELRPTAIEAANAQSFVLNSAYDLANRVQSVVTGLRPEFFV